MKDLPLGGSTTCRRESLEPGAVIVMSFAYVVSCIESGGSGMSEV